MLFRATPLAYGSSQTRGPFGATAAGLHHSHSNIRPKPHLQPTPEQHQILKPLSEVRDRTLNLMVPSRICFHCAMMGTPRLLFLIVAGYMQYKNSHSNLFFFRATPVAYGSSQARGRIRTIAAGLHHSHSNTRSKPCL